MRSADRYAEDRVTLRWILLVTCGLALLILIMQGLYFSQVTKFPIEFLGQ